MAVHRVLTFDQLAAVYRTAFDQVCSAEDWRGPIDCLVPPVVAPVFSQAIEFMTGVAPVSCAVEEGGKKSIRLTCVGYRNGPCGG